MAKPRRAKTPYTLTAFKGTTKNKMKKGTVKFFDEQRGFGFIKEENGEEIFVHASGLTEEIRESDQVLFETEQGKKGLNAINVSKA